MRCSLMEDNRFHTSFRFMSSSRAMRSKADRPLKYFQNTGHISPTRAFQATISSLDRARVLPCAPAVEVPLVDPLGGTADDDAGDDAVVAAVVALVPVEIVGAPWLCDPSFLLEGGGIDRRAARLCSMALR